MPTLNTGIKLFLDEAKIIFQCMIFLVLFISSAGILKVQCDNFHIPLKKRKGYYKSVAKLKQFIIHRAKNNKQWCYCI